MKRRRRARAMNELISVGIFLAAIVGGLLALAPRVSESLVRSRARRLPCMLSERMSEEWLAELDALPGRPSQLAFAIALALTRRHSFAIDEESLFAAPARSPVTVATFGGWPSVVVFTTLVAAAFAYAASFLIPPLYQSHTLVLVVPPRVPARFVEPAVRITLDERLRAISQLVLSRGRLEEMILQFDLYRSDRGLPTSERNSVTNGRDLPAPNGPRFQRCRDRADATRHQCRRPRGLVRARVRFARPASGVEGDGAPDLPLHRGEPP